MAVNLEPIYANRLREFSIEYSDNELDLIHEIIDAVTELDPDIIAGWEIQKGSWGYLEARAKFWGTYQITSCFYWSNLLTDVLRRP